MLSAPHILPRFVPHEVRRDRKQPRSLVLYRRLSQCSHKSLLRNFLSPVAIPQSPRQISHQRGVVRSEESLYIRHDYQRSLIKAMSGSVRRSSPDGVSSIAILRPATMTRSPTENGSRRSGMISSSLK